MPPGLTGFAKAAYLLAAACSSLLGLALGLLLLVLGQLAAAGRGRGCSCRSNGAWCGLRQHHLPVARLQRLHQHDVLWLEVRVDDGQLPTCDSATQVMCGCHVSTACA